MTLRALAGAVAIALVSSGNTLAFSDLTRFAAAFPDDLETPHVFDYTAPLGGFTADGPTVYGPGDMRVAAALMDGAAPEPLTGLDFSAVTGVLGIGDPPTSLTVLFGPDGFAAAAPAALAARDFTETAVEGVPVFARGEDYAVDIANREPDPFDAGMGKSQRLALGGDFLLHTAGWPEMRSTLAALPRPSDADRLWLALIEGVRAASGDDAHLDLASGWSVTAFFDPGPDIGEMMDPATMMKSRSKAPPADEAVVFPVALFALTQDADRASLHLALPFGEEAQARSAARIVADRLVAYPHTPARPRIDVEAVAPYAIAVLSLDFPAAEVAAAGDLYRSWQGDIHRRRFAPLMLGF